MHTLDVWLSVLDIILCLIDIGLVLYLIRQRGRIDQVVPFRSRIRRHRR